MADGPFVGETRSCFLWAFSLALGSQYLSFASRRCDRWLTPKPQERDRHELQVGPALLFANWESGVLLHVFGGLFDDLFEAGAHLVG